MTMPIPDGSVVITPRQMFDELRANTKAIEKLTNTFDPMLGDLRKDVDLLILESGTNSKGIAAIQSSFDNSITPALADLRKDIDAATATGLANSTENVRTRTQLRMAWAFISLAVVACGVLATLYGVAIHH